MNSKEELLKIAEKMIKSIDYDKIKAVQISETPSDTGGTNIIFSFTVDESPKGYYLEEESDFMV